MYKNNFIVTIKHHGRILREVDGEVRLPFGSEYTVLLRNVDSRKALVDIGVDGKNVLSGKQLIMDGHTTQEIKGFMRDMSVTNRFKFIHKTKEISAYRGDRIEDGLVIVQYQFEKENNYIKLNNNWNRRLNDDYWPVPYTPYRSDIKFMNNVCSMSEEGITVKGTKINQQYEYGDIGTVENKSSTIVIRLKGRTKSKKTVTKPLVVKTKLRCPTCGRSSKSSAKFCYNCGTYLE